MRLRKRPCKVGYNLTRPQKTPGLVNTGAKWLELGCQELDGEFVWNVKRWLRPQLELSGQSGCRNVMGSALVDRGIAV